MNNTNKLARTSKTKKMLRQEDKHSGANVMNGCLQSNESFSKNQTASERGSSQGDTPKKNRTWIWIAGVLAAGIIGACVASYVIESEHREYSLENTYIKGGDSENGNQSPSSIIENTPKEITYETTYDPSYGTTYKPTINGSFDPTIEGREVVISFNNLPFYWDNNEKEFIEDDGLIWEEGIKITLTGYKYISSGNNILLQTMSVDNEHNSYWYIREDCVELNDEPLEAVNGFINGHEWVDLGLSVKWATCNVGASNPGDYGGYYAWGETSTKSNYIWSNCFDCLDNEGERWGVYKIGGLTCIKPSSGHDTARETWGNSWRLPSVSECDELCNRCVWSWVSRNGHDGYLVTGPNGNCIFLPAADCIIGKDNGEPGKYGNYWTNSLTPGESGCAQYLYICRDCSTKAYICGNGGRRDGFSVRPVTDG